MLEGETKPDTLPIKRQAHRWAGRTLHGAVKSDFVQKIVETFATRIVLIPLGLVSSVLISRSLGPEGRGIFTAAAALTAIGIQFGNLGLHASNTYTVAKSRDLLPVLTGNSLLVSFGLGGLIGGIAWIVFSVRPDFSPVHGLPLILALIGIPVSLALMLFQNLLLGINEVRAYNTIDLATKLLSVVVILLIVILGAASVETIYGATIVIVVGVLIWTWWRLGKQFIGPPRTSWSLLTSNIAYSLKAYLAAFFSFMVIRADLLLVQYMLGARDLGFYSLAVTMTDMISMLPVVVGTILFPRLSAMTTDSEKWTFTKNIAALIALLMVAITVLAVLFAAPVIQLFYGQIFLPAYPAFVFLMPAITFLSINTIFMNYFASIGMPSIVVYSPGAAMVLNILANLILLPRLGIVGASISSILAYGMMLIFSIAFIYVRGRKTSGKLS